MIRPGDVVILLLGAVLIALLGVNAWSAGDATTLRVTQGERAHVDYSLAAPRIVEVAGPLGTTRIEIRDGRARVVASPCTRKICMRSGWLEASGEATACIPNRVSLVLLGGETRFDAMSF